jgi:hypothetical protein
MNKIDFLCIPKDAPPFKPDDDEIFVGVPQVSETCKSIVNFRDLRGRTPLHVAAALNHRNACETLLFLGANPLVEDIYGQRPIDMIGSEEGSSLKLLLQSKMARFLTQPLKYYKIERIKARPGALSYKAAKPEQNAMAN